jgi:hypothetical protein
MLEARDVATEGARKLLLQEILNTAYGEGTIGGRARRNPQLLAEIEAMVGQAEPTKVDFTDDACRVTIVFPRSRLSRLNL